MNEKADIQETGRGTYTVTPARQSGTFRDRFLQRYAMEQTRKQAQADGYTVIEKEEDGQQVMILRQY